MSTSSSSTNRVRPTAAAAAEQAAAAPAEGTDTGAAGGGALEFLLAAELPMIPILDRGSARDAGRSDWQDADADSALATGRGALGLVSDTDDPGTMGGAQVPHEDSTPDAFRPTASRASPDDIAIEAPAATAARIGGEVVGGPAETFLGTRPDTGSDTGFIVAPPNLSVESLADDIGRIRQGGGLNRDRALVTELVADSADPAEFPYSALVWVLATLPDGTQVSGSGVVVGPNDVLTASHVVTQGDGTQAVPATEVVVFPGRDDGEAPFGSFTAVDIDHFQVDVDGDGLQNIIETQNDVALLSFDQPLGALTGMFDIDYTGTSGTYRVTGYPGLFFTDEGEPRLTEDEGFVEPDPTFGVHLIDQLEVNSGNSGGPIWRFQNGTPTVIGVVGTGLWAADVGFNQATIEDWILSNDTLIGGGGGDELNPNPDPDNNAPTLADPRDFVLTRTEQRPGPNEADLGDVFAALFSDPDGDPVVAFRFEDLRGGGRTAYLNTDAGGRLQARTVHEIAIQDMDTLTVVGGTHAGTDTIRVSAYDGAAWSAPQTFTITTTEGGNARPEWAPIPDQMMDVGESVDVSSTFGSFLYEPNLDDQITAYRILDYGVGGETAYFESGTGERFIAREYHTLTPQEFRDLRLVAGSQESRVVDPQTGEVVQGGRQPDRMYFMAFDGEEWSALAPFTVRTGNTAPIWDNIPNLDLNRTADFQLGLQIPNLVSDPDGDTITRYQVWDRTGGGRTAYLSADGTGRIPAEQPFTIMPEDIASLTVTGGSSDGFDRMYIRAADGSDYSDWLRFDVFTRTNSPPEIDPIPDVRLAAGEQNAFGVAVPDRVSDQDGNTITQYQFRDNGAGAETAYFSITDEGRQPAGTEITVTALEVGSVSIIGGSAAGTETMEIRAFDGQTFSEWQSFDVITNATTGIAAPDLTPTQMSIADPIGRPNGSVEATITIANEGTATAENFFTVFFLSEDRIIDDNDTRLSFSGGGLTDARFLQTEELEAGSQFALTVRLNLPGAASGAFPNGDTTYYIGAEVDLGDAVDESDEFDNGTDEVGLLDSILVFGTELG